MTVRSLPRRVALFGGRQLRRKIDTKPHSRHIGVASPKLEVRRLKNPDNQDRGCGFAVGEGSSGERPLTCTDLAAPPDAEGLPEMGLRALRGRAWRPIG
ncbi:hypothetical protein Tbd_2128 [Thiobacillus denitrificans ATCC 25259]|uniref:Uncharacterized protein n=1 Tax=Thiobacillus denitrificans (strain ATCC 25259 / T1) TaxID=292415 RepID=Q3SH08_THIDA|nr:hypothetical protein Tbd_2128 [Thiobacillus denitrificans ATCC 25259]